MIYCMQNKDSILAKVQYLSFWEKVKCMFVFPHEWRKIWLS
jgi:hypothetical protein